MSKAVAVLNKFIVFPLCGMIFFREDCDKLVGIEHFETDLGWMFSRSSTHIIIDTVRNYEKIISEDVMSRPFSFQTVVTAKNYSLSHVLDKLYYIIINTQMHFLNFMKMSFRQKPSYRVHF